MWSGPLRPSVTDCGVRFRVLPPHVAFIRLMKPVGLNLVVVFFCSVCSSQLFLAVSDLSGMLFQYPLALLPLL